MRKALILFLLFIISYTQAQSLKPFADSIRIAYQVPELCYAVISSDSIIDIQYLGNKKAGTIAPAAPTDRFRIGSNTKAVTAAIAAQMVAEHKIAWDTKFFDLYPELKAESDPAYYDMTLLGLLNFQVHFPMYTYTDVHPKYTEITTDTKDDASQLINFVKWFLHHKPVPQPAYRSNVSYSAAGLMLGRAAHMTYAELRGEMNNRLHISFGTGSPNTKDRMQVWGHTKKNKPEPPGDSYKLNWLLPAGNINATLPDYVRFIQMQLMDRKKEGTNFITNENASEFSLGWYQKTDPAHHIMYHNMGNPGSFTTEVWMIPSIDRAYIIFTNSQNENTYAAVEAMMTEMKKRFGQ